MRKLKPTTHKLKIDKIFYKQLLTGKKPFEYRKTNKDYKVNDYVKFIDNKTLEDLNEFQIVATHRMNTIYFWNTYSTKLSDREYHFLKKYLKNEKEVILLEFY